MNSDEYVYCTHCVNFQIVEKGIGDYYPKCKFSDVCDLWDCEDSKPFKDRPKYQSIAESENT